MQDKINVVYDTYDRSGVGEVIEVEVSMDEVMGFELSFAWRFRILFTNILFLKTC